MLLGTCFVLLGPLFCVVSFVLCCVLVLCPCFVLCPCVVSLCCVLVLWWVLVLWCGPCCPSYSLEITLLTKRELVEFFVL